ncbi:MAG: diguanylate cyclase [Burkholderiales bacterium]|nr:diguanylate cyclase [Burkholderiales bacterium]
MNDLCASVARSGAIKLLQQEWVAAMGTGSPLSCIVVRIKRMQLVSEAYGRDAVDAALYEVASRLRACFVRRELLCSLGGGSFLVICPGSTPECALKMASAIEARVASGLFACREGTLDLKVSCGVATADCDTVDPGGLIRAVEHQLLRMQSQGDGRGAAA